MNAVGREGFFASAVAGQQLFVMKKDVCIILGVRLRVPHLHNVYGGQGQLI